MTDVWCQKSDDRCLITVIWCKMSHDKGMMSDDRCLRTDVWCEMSDKRCLITDIWWQRYDVWCQMSEDRCLITDVRWQRYNVRRVMPVVLGSLLMGITELDFGDVISFLFIDCNIGSDFEFYWMSEKLTKCTPAWNETVQPTLVFFLLNLQGLA